MTDHPTLEGFTECSHGYRGPHCIRDEEGSCPFEYDRANPAADCRCTESVWLEIPIPAHLTGDTGDTVEAALPFRFERRRSLGLRILERLGIHL